EKVPIISIGGYYMEGKTLADIGREMETYRRAGMAGCKFKVGGLSPPADAQRVDAARKAAGPDFILAVDANRGWTADEALHFAILGEPLTRNHAIGTMTRRKWLASGPEREYRSTPVNARSQATACAG